MPTRKRQVKRKTSLPKFLRDIDFIGINEGRLKETEPSTRGRVTDIADASLVCVPSDGQQRRDTCTKLDEAYRNCQVPVVGNDGKPLMPTKASRARRWIKSNKATPFFQKGLFCIRLKFEPSGTCKQDVCVGVDPGSKFEGFTVKSKKHTFLNVQVQSVDWVKREVKTRREMRIGRRGENTPCRQPRFYRNRGKTSLPPSTKARWQWKLRIIDVLTKVYPVTSFCVEDIKAKTKKWDKRWNSTFSPLETGKSWFYENLRQKGTLHLKQGYKTKALRDTFGLSKNKKKSSKTFDAHCVDSWVLANSIVGGDILDNKSVIFINPIRLHRRRLHYLQPSKGGKRKNYGGTRSLGLKRGGLVKHPKYNFCYVGGTSKDRISLHSLEDGKRLCQNAKVEDCKFLSYNTFVISKKQTIISNKHKLRLR